MDKNAIKKFAISARRELIARVSQRAEKFGIEEKKPMDPYAVSVGGHVLSSEEQQQRKNLIERIKASSYELVMEEAAYTWFNRFCALRYMEVNGYLPSRVRVFTNEENEFEPQILKEAINLDLPGLEMERVYAYKDADQNEELYRYLLITQCNALSKVLPGMFRRLADFTELLLPDNLLRESSVIHSLVTEIPQEDWQDQVQIIGWLYEGYNTERNEIVYDGNMSKSRITKELLPAATTIFTPDWPVRYMVENSLGRLWLEGHPDAELQAQWKYYLEEAPQEPQVQAQLSEIRRDYAKLTPEDIKVIDPCMGSGHILAYMFDVLLQIYRFTGYSERDAVASIVKKNLFGLDIDDRAAQLAYFSVMMKARQYDRRFFSRNIQPRVYAIQESNTIPRSSLKFFGTGLSPLERNNAQTQLLGLLDTLHDAKEYGSILNVPPCDWPLLRSFLTLEDENFQLDMEAVNLHETQTQLLELVEIAETMAQKYHAVVTNPPYLGNARFSPLLDTYVKKHYADVKSDLSMVMYDHAITSMCAPNGFISFITTSSWMFLSSFEKLRLYQQKIVSFSSLVDYGTELFDGKVGHNSIVSWVVRKKPINSAMTAIRLVDYCYARRDEKEPEFFNLSNRYFAQQDNFSKIPGSPVAYWVSKNFYTSYNQKSIADYAEVITGMTIGDNNKYLRQWFELQADRISFGCSSMSQVDMLNKYWIPYSKGGPRRNWYGNYEYVVNWSKKDCFNRSKTTLQHLYLKEALTWPFVTMGLFSARILPTGFLWDVAGSPCFFKNQNTQYYTLALLASKVANYILKVVNPTINVQAIDIAGIPLLVNHQYENHVTTTARQNIDLSKCDWDSFETSWDFTRHPLLPENTAHCTLLTDHYSRWESEAATRFAQLKANEEALNRIFIDIYGLQDELTPEVADKDVTVRKADLQRDIRNLISYAVGCMFGRYSLDVPGLAYAGGGWDGSKYQTFLPDEDNIIPICDDEYFEDDIVSRFVAFIETVYGKDTLEENLRFIADSLGGKGQPREVFRNYFLNDFYADHLRTYQKRPIYWLFDSGKKNGFKALIYMHRYRPDTVARIRTDYVHEQQSRYRTAAEDLSRRLNDATGSERARLTKRLATLTAQSEELRTYEEKIHHLADRMLPIDLDDGVKVNYAKFEDVLAKIK